MSQDSRTPETSPGETVVKSNVAPPRYYCVAENCRGNHTSKWEVCIEAPDGHDPDISPDGHCRICGKYEPE